MSDRHDFGGPNPIGGPAGAPPPPPPPPPQAPWQPPQQEPPAQWPQEPPPYQDYPPQYPPQYPGQFYPNQFGPNQIQPRPPKRRKGLLIGIGAAAAVIVLVVAGVVIFSGSGAGGGGAATPGEAVQGYLDALARGDAEAALSFSQQVPPDKTFLTDEILKKQAEKYPITNITILGENTSAKGATVQVRADFGGKTSDQEITLPKPADGDDWKLQRGVASVDANIGNLTSKKLVEMVTIFGKPVPKTGKAYLFPGWVDFGSTNPNVEIVNYKDEPPSLQEIWLGLSSSRPEYSISEAGQKAIRDALKSMADECARSNQLEPPDCPNDFKIPSAVEGTAKWTAPTNFDDIDADFLDQRTATVRLYGSTEWGITVQTDRGPYSTTTTAYVTGEADISQDPPKITLER
ncbi:protein of unknown function [Mycolicibacterium rutilum]|uniref:Uncharacterized protein n=1 Tax=Mycolicibacterium rutilum TaxID=370526 RepID=A0A1H6ID57_MYCRU|nr:DUF4878 domain-containing protein [Mycolicibacterium rutilum]SEH46746.1 protein of unknown function [Mycolicibacterium rutilum]